MPEASELVLDFCTQVQCNGQPCKIITDSMTCGEKCLAEAAAADACEIFC
ncbi:hypothetical protein HNQ62_002826 [Sulfurisphaera ohwakuensis]|uniref:Uncharacterized protein n=1 Tax=Sulfurisphaera ohwakuensis TaxID=69656 RepID=A0A7J9RW48_SULOH|nr:hypothetical protein [Sulfurisphaera ohwakuensis]